MTLLLGFAAVNTGNNLLYLLVSALLGFMAVSGLFGQRNLQRITLHCRLSGEAYAGFPAQYQLELTNQRRWLPTCLLQVRFGSEVLLFPLVPAGQRRRQTLTLTLPERGLQRLPEPRVSSCFPVNFFVRSRSLRQEQQVLVFPRPRRGRLPAGAAENRFSRQTDLHQPGIDGELRSIDSYQAGDPVKSIHWKHSARQDEHKVKRLNRLGMPAQLLDLSAFPGTLEEQLGQCTYLVNQLHKRQQAVGLRLAKHLIPPALGNAHRLRLLSEMARYAED